MGTTTERVRLHRDDVVDAAEAVVDEQGWDGLTMAELAVRLGIKAPSLYTHVRSVDDLRAELQVRTMRAFAEDLRTAAMGRTGVDAFRTLAGSMRAFARRFPHRYDGMTRAVLDRDAFEPAALGASEALLAVLRSLGVDGDVGYEAQAAGFAALHGLVALERSGFFDSTIDDDRVYERVLAGALHAATWTPPAADPVPPPARSRKRTR